MQTLIKNLDQLVEAAIKGKTKTLVVAAAEDKYVLNAIAKAREAGLIHPIFIGDKEKLKKSLWKLGWAFQTRILYMQTAKVKHVCGL